MKLIDYMKAEKLRQDHVASKLGISRSSLYHYMVGKRTPPLQMALKILRFTNGEVRLADWDGALDQEEPNLLAAAAKRSWGEE